MKECKYCGEELPTEKKRNTFCNSSCSASFNNQGVRRHGKEPEQKECLTCSKTFTVGRNTGGLYCSIQCHSDHRYNLYITSWKNGDEDGTKSGGAGVSGHIRRYLFEKYDSKCSRCGWDTPNPFIDKLILEIEHIDGNSVNNNEDNLDLICPNCHSLTPTYKALNAGNGNKARLIYNRLK